MIQVPNVGSVCLGRGFETNAYGWLCEDPSIGIETDGFAPLIGLQSSALLALDI